MTKYELPDNLDVEIDDLEDLIARFKKGEVSATEIKVRRVPFGVYEQRKKDTYMVRIRCAGACVTPEQLKKIAELSKEYGAPYFHITSRQEVQMHYVDLDNVITIIREIKKVGLSSRGGGGNTVRNIMAQEDSGISLDEVFDITPYAVTLTSRIASESDSWNLPRKFKIAFSGSLDDRGYATISDVGFIACLKDGQKGFKVYMAGGLGAKAEVGNLIFDFVPECEIYNITRAAKTLFFKYGNRRNKHAARMRFLWKTLGGEEFKKRFHQEYEDVKQENPPVLAIKEIPNVGIEPQGISSQSISAEDQDDFQLWKKRFVRTQRQQGLFSIILPVELGHIKNDQALKLAEFLAHFGENVIRMSKDQNFLVRNILEKYLPNVYAFIKETLDNFNRPFIIDKILSCAGASTCQLGICLSPGATRATRTLLGKSDLDLDLFSGVTLNISGCPNSCGQHPVADLGFFGKVARNGEHVYPAYNVLVGAIVHDGKTKLAEKIGEVSARDLPKLVEEFFKSYLIKTAEYKDFQDYIQNTDRNELKELCKKYKQIPEFDVDKNYYFDWGSDKAFSLAERGKGECSAGMFDLLEMDIGNVRKIREQIAKVADDLGKKQECLREVVFFSARTLLITRGVSVKTEAEVYAAFKEHFIQTGLVDALYESLTNEAERKDYAQLLQREGEVNALADRIKFLYDHMDNVFQFQVDEKVQIPEVATTPTPKEKESEKSKITKDFRGVACPMNFVKTKMELSKIKSGDVLEVLLDDGEPIENVPGSLREEGHNILGQNRVENYWSLVIGKK